MKEKTLSCGSLWHIQDKIIQALKNQMCLQHVTGLSWNGSISTTPIYSPVDLRRMAQSHFTQYPFIQSATSCRVTFSYIKISKIEVFHINSYKYHYTLLENSGLHDSTAKFDPAIFLSRLHYSWADSSTTIIVIIAKYNYRSWSQLMSLGVDLWVVISILYIFDSCSRLTSHVLESSIVESNCE